MLASMLAGGCTDTRECGQRVQVVLWGLARNAVNAGQETAMLGNG